MEIYFHVLKVNLKHNLLKSLSIILIFFIIAPFIMEMKNLEEPQVGQILEMYISLFGAVMLIPLFIPDEDLSIRYLLQSKKQSMIMTHLIRLFEQIVILLGAVFLFMFILKVGNSSFDFTKLYFAVISNCLFLGGLGVLCYSIVNSLPFAYMGSIFYYAFCFGAGKKYLGDFYLFYMSSCKYENDIYIFVAGVLMIAFGVFYRDFFMRIR